MRRDLLTTVLFALLLTLPAGCAGLREKHKASDDAPAAKGGGATQAASQDDADKAPKKGGGKDSEGKAGKKDGDDEEDKEAKEAKKKEEAEKNWKKKIEDLEKATGFFTTYHDDQKLLLELDKTTLGRPFVYFGALNSGLGSFGIYRGAMLYDSPYIVRLERRGEKIALVAENTAYLEGQDARQERMLGESVSEGIIKAFDLAAELEDEGRVLIDLGGWFKSDNLNLARQVGGKFSAASDLSLIKSLKSFPKNVEVELELVLTGSNASSGNMAMADGRGTVVSVQHSLVALPEDGYKPRAFDQRVGYFYTERKDLFDRQSDDPVRRFINRWRLVKKDPTAEVSDPVTPIVYWVENSTPPSFRKAVAEGIEVWEPAFRKAGFSNAIVAKQMPDDADWDPADVRYSVVRWSEDENVGFAIGPSRVDPRTGEIFDADITMQASFLNTYAERFDTYIASAAARSKQEILEDIQKSMRPEFPQDIDLRARCELMGEERALQLAVAATIVPILDPAADRQAFLEAMIREVTAHEVGHTLGMRHNFKGSTFHSLDELADSEATMSTGVTGSFMEYSPINIAAPGEPQGEYFQSAIGPYDFWTIEYGYREFGNNEEKQLRTIADKSHELGRDYGTDEDSFIGDAFAATWDMGSDPVEFALRQIALAEWGLGRLLEKGADKNEGFHKYARYYQMFQLHYDRSYRGLHRFIGGYTFNRDVVGQAEGRDPIVPVDPELQRRALSVMIDKGLRWTGGIPDDQRLLLANKKFGSFGSWFDFWRFDPLPRLVNASRWSTLVPLMMTDLYERLGTQSRLVKQGGLSTREVAQRVFDTVWPELGADDARPDEHDLWTQSDYLLLLFMGLEQDVTPQVTALFHDMLQQAEERLEQYAGSSDDTTATHGRWLGDRIRRYRERQKIEF